MPIPRRSKQKKTTKAKDTAEPLHNVNGVLRKLEDGAIEVEAQDTRTITVKRTEKTKFFKDGVDIKPGELKIGDQLLIEATQDEQGYFYAVNVILQKREGAPEAKPAETKSTEAKPKESEATEAKSTEGKPPEAAAPTVATASAPSSPPVEDEDDPGRPRLRRGKPEKRPSREPKVEEISQVAENREPAPVARIPVTVPPPVEPSPEEPKRDPFIEKAREAAGTFLESLPNYVCQEHIARYASNSHIVDFRPLDIVTAEVIYENRSERYRNIAINGKPSKKSMEELPGAWSTGEFGTVLADLFSPGTAADFRYRKESTSAGIAARVYDFTVEQDHSHWKVMTASQYVLPAYRGSVWIDKKNGRVLRIEMQATRVPLEFPLDKVESTTDYEYVRFAEQQYLVPVHAEILSCQRGTNICSKNTIDFRNYHKYSGESNITYK